MDPPQFESLNRRRNQGQAPPPNRPQTITDPGTFQNRNDIYTKNANLFIANNANPFLISPYAPPANLISKQLIEQLSALISTLSYSISSVINLNTYTLSISTIQPVPSDIPNQQIKIIASTLIITGAPGATMQVQNSSFFSTINASSTTTGYLGYSTLTGSTITTNTLFANTSISSPAISTALLNTNAIVASTVFAATSISTNAIVASTIQAATYVSTTQLTFSSMFIAPTPNFSSNLTITSSIRIDIGGVAYLLPVIEA